MKNIQKLTVCALLLFAAFDIFARPNKQRAIIINNYGADIYCRPNSGDAITIKNGSSGCLVASTSGSTLGPIKICSQADWNTYKLSSSSIINAATAYFAVESASNKASIKNENVAVVTSDGKKGHAPSVQIYSGQKAYVAAHPGATFIACGNLDQH